jgi:hypothetical protein
MDEPDIAPSLSPIAKAAADGCNLSLFLESDKRPSRGGLLSIANPAIAILVTRHAVCRRRDLERIEEPVFCLNDAQYGARQLA